MKRIPMETMLRTLRTFPQGATTRELAERLGVKPKSLASRLSKAFNYGRGVDYIERPCPTFGREYVWRAE